MDVTVSRRKRRIDIDDRDFSAGDDRAGGIGNRSDQRAGPGRLRKHGAGEQRCGEKNANPLNAQHLSILPVFSTGRSILRSRIEDMIHEAAFARKGPGVNFGRRLFSCRRALANWAHANHAVTSR